MKILAINGSPKGKNSNTNVMVESFLKGAKSKGAQTEQIFLSDKKIHHCIGCFHCWIQTPGKCIFKDDMEKLLEKFIEADIAIYASPLYFDNVTGLMKNYFDRTIPLVSPYFEKDENNQTVHVLRSKKHPKLIIMSNCGYPEENNFEVLSYIFKRVARNQRTKIIDEIYKAQGTLLKVTSSKSLQPLLKEYRKNLQIAGEEIVEKEEISETTKKNLKKPFLDPDVYIQLVHKRWDEELSKIKNKDIK